MRSLMILILVSCANEHPASPPDAPAPPDAQSETWSDAYAAYAAADCAQLLRCDPAEFDSLYVDLGSCEGQVVSWDCEADPDCDALYAKPWALVLACEQALGETCAEFPAACTALAHSCLSG
jgi:hypothetical protein